MASAVVQLELEEGEINEEYEKRLGTGRPFRPARPSIRTTRLDDSSRDSSSIMAVKMEQGVTASLDVDSDSIVLLTQDDDDDCVVTYEKPAVRPHIKNNSVINGPVISRPPPLPKKRQRSPAHSPSSPARKKQSSIDETLLAMAVPAGYERQAYKLQNANKKPVDLMAMSIRRKVLARPKTEESNYNRTRLRLDQASSARKAHGAPTPSRGFYRSKYIASHPWRSRTRTRSSISWTPAARRPKISSEGNHRRQVRSTTRQKPSSFSSASRSSVAEPSFDDLMAQYRRIRSQLEDLGHEDECEEEEEMLNADILPFAAELEENKGSGNEIANEIDVVEPTEDVNKENVISDVEYIELCTTDSKNEKITRWDKLPHPQRRRVSSRSSSGHKNISLKAKIQTKEEDDDELELRRIALASAFTRKPRKGLSENIERSRDSLEEQYDRVSSDSMECLAPLPPLPPTPPPQPPPPPPPPMADCSESKVGDEDDEDILRAMLLSSLSNKQLEKNTKLGSTAAQLSLLSIPHHEIASSNVLSEVSSESDAGGSLVGQKVLPQKSAPAPSSKAQLQPVFVAPPLPKHDPVVISLKDDTDSETEGESTESTSKDVSLFSTIDSFLSEVRQKVDLSKQEKQYSVKKVNDPKTPTAVLSLPSLDLEEYRRLKAEIQKREQVMATASVAVRHGVSSETITVTIPQNSAKPKTVVVRRSSPDTSHTKNNLRAQMKTCESNLQQHCQKMSESQRELQQLKVQMNAKEGVIKSADNKISKLREQLAAAEKVADAQRASLETVKRRREGLSNDVDRMKLEKQRLQGEYMAYGKRLHGDSFQFPHSLRILGVRRKSMTTVNPASGLSTKKKRLEPQRKVVLQQNSAKRLKGTNPEMIRLKAMEQEIALKLQVLRRRANNSATTSGNNSPSSVERRTGSFLEKYQSTKPKISQVPSVSRVNAVAPAPALPSASATAVDVSAQPINYNRSAVRFTDLQIQTSKLLVAESANNLTLNRISSVALNSYAFHRQKDFITGIKIDENSIATNVEDTTSTVIGSYTSPLLHCRAYRFSPYFRNKANHCLTWPTYVHKLSPRKILCRFELTGTCNDDECLGQHIRDYAMTPKGVLCDIVSYCPPLADVSDNASTEESKLKIEAYVEKLLNSNSDRMTHDQLCILTVGRVNDALGKAPPHYITFDERRWRPGPETDDAFDMDYEPIKNKKRNILSKGSHYDDVVPDEVVGEGDSRYFSNSGEAADALEFAVLKSPTDANLWLRLAYKKLEGRERSSDVSLDMALNVLSRGLEENLHNKDLWIHYLSLYSKRKEPDDLLGLCEQAVDFCPCYEIWWKYLQEINIFATKREVCKSMLTFVVKSDVDPETKSRQIFEVLLYDVQLNILSNRFDDGKKLLEVALDKRNEKATDDQTENCFQCLADVDKCVLWLCYIHVVEFQCLPNSLFDPANSGLGRVVCTTPFLLPWCEGRKFRTSVTHVRKLFMVALRKCVRKGQSAMANAQMCLPLYRNLMALELCRNKLHSIKHKQHRLLAISTFNEAVKSSSPSSLVHYFAASYELSVGNAGGARDYISRYVATFFESLDESKLKNNGDLVEEMYSQLLGLAITTSANVHILKAAKSDVSKRKPYLWLSYCIWLEALGRHSDVVEAYEAAIVQMLSTVDLQIVWLRYLQYSLQRITAASSSSTPEQNFAHYTSLVYRCLTSVPRLIASCSRTDGQKLWTDYSFFNKVVDSYVHVLDESRRIAAYQSFSSLAPENAALALTLMELYLKAGQYREAWSFTKNQLEHSPHSWDFWNVAIYLAKRMKRISVARLLYEDAVDALPFNFHVWKEFIIFELANDQLENAERLLNRCAQSGISVDGFLHTVSKD